MGRNLSRPFLRSPYSVESLIDKNFFFSNTKSSRHQPLLLYLICRKGTSRGQRRDSLRTTEDPDAWGAVEVHSEGPKVTETGKSRVGSRH